MKVLSLESTPTLNSIFAHSDFGLDHLQVKIFTRLLSGVQNEVQCVPILIDVEEILGDDPKQDHYFLLEEALNELAAKRLTKPGLNRRSLGFYPIFQYVKYSDTSSIEALFSPYVIQELYDLTCRYSIEEIARFLMLHHSHSQRMFWFLREYENKGKVEVTVEALREVMLGVRKYRHKDAEYERYYDFKTRVLDQAILAIRDKGLLDIRYKEYRHKRMVTHITLNVTSCKLHIQQTKPSSQLVLF